MAEDVETGLAALSQGQMRHWRSGRIPNVRYSFGGLRLVSAWRQDLWVLRRAASALAVAVLKVGGLMPARGGLTAHR